MTRTAGAQSTTIAARSLDLAARNPTVARLALMRALNRVQLKARELLLVASSVRARPGCNLLVFGLGNDSAFWRALNDGGRTVFLEDNARWFERVTADNPALDARLVSYGTRRTEWREMLGSARALDLELPDDVKAAEWDVVLVDAPAGWNDNTPGRMRSIAAASRLARAGGDVFVHDCDREIEQVYASHYLHDQNLVAEVRRLRQYRVP